MAKSLTSDPYNQEPLFWRKSVFELRWISKYNAAKELGASITREFENGAGFDP